MSLELNIPTEVQLLRTVLTALGNESDHLLNEKVVPKTLRVITQMEPYLGDLLIIRSTIRQQILDNSSKKVGDVVGSLVDKALTLYQGLLEVLVVHFGFLPETEHSFKTALRWLRLTCEDRLESYFKIQSCYLFSLVTKQNKLIDELPEFPQWISEFGDRPGYIQGGKLWRMSRKAIATPDLSKHEIAAFYAITNVKRAGLAISEKLQEASILKHQKNMVGAEYKPKAVCHVVTPEESPTQCELVPPEEALSDILEKIELLVGQVYHGKVCRPKWKSPSTRACYENSASKCGSHIFWREDIWTTICRQESPELLCFVEYKGRVTEIKVPYHPEDLLHDLMYKIEHDPEIALDATVHKVLEPFKCRVITAGPGHLYQAGRCIMTELHRVLRLNKLFKLIGMPCSKEYINEMYSGIKLDQPGNPFKDSLLREFFVAGDYSAATDGMHPSIPLKCVDSLYLIGYFDKVQRKVVSNCMKGHRLHYWKDDRETVVEQTWGQLMGAPNSFIFLCLANAAVNWVAAEYYFGGSLSYEEWVEWFRPIFNGDDTSFLSNTLHYEIWRQVASCAGLNSSLGKSYCSPDFVMINSELYVPEVDENGVISEFQDVFVLNPGLIKGQAKVIEDDREDRISYQVNDCKYNLDRDWKLTTLDKLLPLVDQLNKATQKCSPFEVEQCKNIFLGHVMERLKKSNRPWSVPRMLGGLGLSGVGHSTYSQRKAVAYLLMQEDVKSLIRGPREQPDYLVTSRGMMDELEEALGVSYTKSMWIDTDLVSPAARDLFANDYDDSFTFDSVVFGEKVETVGEDNYGKLLKEALKAPWVKEISLEGLAKYEDGSKFYIPSIRDAPIILR